VPADYAGDELLINWTKPDYNPIMENTQVHHISTAPEV
jgi:hypothetical protein